MFDLYIPAIKNTDADSDALRLDASGFAYACTDIYGVFRPKKLFLFNKYNNH